MASRLAYIAVLALVACGTQNTSAQRQQDKDQAKIINCVHSVLTDEKMGYIDIDVTGSGFALLEAHDPTVAGGRIGKGRVIAAGHDSFLKQEPESELKSDRAKFIDNMWAWIHLDNSRYKSVGVVSTRIPSLMSRLTWKQVYGTLSSVKMADVSSTKADVLIIDGDFSKDYAYALIERVRQGMGVVILAANYEYASSFKNQYFFNTGWGPNIVAMAAGFQFRRGEDRAGTSGPDKKRLWPPIPYKCKGERGR